MIVCDLTHAYHKTSGGIRTYIDLKRRYILDHTDHDHVLVVPGAATGVERGNRWTTYQIKAPYIPGAKPYRFFAGTKLLRGALKDARPDVIELNTFYIPCEYRAAFSYRKASDGAIVGVHVHTDFADSYIRSYAKKIVGNWLSKLLQRFGTSYVNRILGRANFSITLSPLHQKKLQNGGSCVDLISQFVDLDQFNPNRSSVRIRRRLGLKPNSLLLCYIGRIDSEKNIPMLLEVVEKLPDSFDPHLVLAGDGSFRESVSQYAECHDRVTVLPYILDKDAVAELLSSSDIYVTAGPHEVAAFSVVEAQASGLPVVGVAAGGLINRIPRDDIGRLVPINDANAMANAITLIAEDLKSYGNSARKHAESNYSTERCFRDVFEVYHREMKKR